MQLVLHIGAHRTGSTLIERMISALALARPDLGLRVWNPRVMRAIPDFQRVPGMLRASGEPVSDEAAARFAAVQVDVSRRLDAAKAEGVKTLLISEENICGGMQANFRKGRFYPGVGPRLMAFAKVLGRAPRRVALGLREYGAQWNSAYAYLDSAGNDLPGHRDAAAMLTAAKRGWPAIVAAMRAAWPGAEAMLWRQEDMDARRVAARLCDLDPALFAPADAGVNSNAKAIELFTEPERARLSRRYTRHVAALSNDAELTWAVAP